MQLPDVPGHLAVISLLSVAGAFAGWCSVGLALRYGGLLQLLIMQDNLTAPQQALVMHKGLYLDSAGLLARAFTCGRLKRAGCCAGAANRALAFFAAALMLVCTIFLERRYGLSVTCMAICCAMLVLLILTVVDAKTSLLPDVLTLSLLWLGLVLAWWGGPVSLHDAVAGAVFGYGFLYTLFLVFKCVRRQDGMGYGDFKLAAALGAWVGVAQLPVLLLMASVLGLMFAMVRRQGAVLASRYPFGPFLAASGATILVILPEVHSYL